MKCYVLNFLYVFASAELRLAKEISVENQDILGEIEEYSSSRSIET